MEGVEWHSGYWNRKQQVLVLLKVPIGLLGRVFANGPGDLGSIPGRLKKWYLISPCLTLGIIRYILRVKWCNPRKGVAPFPTPWCSSY